MVGIDNPNYRRAPRWHNLKKTEKKKRREKETTCTRLTLKSERRATWSRSPLCKRKKGGSVPFCGEGGEEGEKKSVCLI